MISLMSLEHAEDTPSAAPGTLHIPSLARDCPYPESHTACSLPSFRSSIDSEPALVLGPLKSVQELRREQQLAEIESRRQEREKSGKEEAGAEGMKPPIQEMVDELQGPFSYDFSYWARYALLGSAPPCPLFRGSSSRRDRARRTRVSFLF